MQRRRCRCERLLRCDNAAGCKRAAGEDAGEGGGSGEEEVKSERKRSHEEKGPGGGKRCDAGCLTDEIRLKRRRGVMCQVGVTCHVSSNWDCCRCGFAYDS